MKNTLLALLFTLPLGILNAQTIGTFNSLQPQPQTEILSIPSSHAFQLLTRAEDELGDGTQQGPASDFTAYVPINGSSQHGYLCINSEFVPGGVSVLEIKLNTETGLWETKSSGKVDFSDFNCNIPVFGQGGTMVNCSGGITPWGTVVTSEEADFGGCTTADGYVTFGWNVEFDPATRKVVDYDNNGVADKVWAQGRMKHENICFLNDSITSYFGDDNSTTGYVFKFVANEKKNLSSGNLYVLKLNNPPQTGSWVQIPNTTVAERNGVLAAAGAAGGAKLDRVEDLEIGPDGKVYVTSTGADIVYRFNDDGTTISGFEIFVDKGLYDIEVNGSVVQANFTAPDNLVFDNEGNLWVNQDGGDNHFWLVAPDHTAANPKIKVFANTPKGCETTGTTFTPDFKYMFFSMQHPEAGNNTTQVDAANQNVMYNKDATVVVARAEVLGQPQTNSVRNKGNNAFSKLEVYPNPVKDVFTLKLSSGVYGKAKLAIFDVAGKQLWAYDYFVSYGINELQVNTKGIAKGSYFISAIHEKGTQKIGFIKE